MEWKQHSIAEMLESETQMVLRGHEHYGEHYDLASTVTIFIGTALKSVHQDRWVFASFMSMVKKYHMLALFSTLRLHQIQATMNLRQMLEAAAMAAFALANPDPQHFVLKGEDGLMRPSKKLNAKIYAWLDANYPDGSKGLKDSKELINESTAHANLIFASRTFDDRTDEGRYGAPFFDITDEWQVQSDLWRIANLGLFILDLFYGVNKSAKGIVFVDDFTDRFMKLAQQTAALREQMVSSERYKRVMESKGQLAPS